MARNRCYYSSEIREMHHPIDPDEAKTSGHPHSSSQFPKNGEEVLPQTLYNLRVIGTTRACVPADRFHKKRKPRIRHLVCATTITMLRDSRRRISCRSVKYCVVGMGSCVYAHLFPRTGGSCRAAAVGSRACAECARLFKFGPSQFSTEEVQLRSATFALPGERSAYSVTMSRHAE